MGKDIKVVLGKGAQDLGLAVMLKDLLLQNLEQNPHKKEDFKKLNIDIGLTVPDAEISLTMSFRNGALTIYPAIKGKPGLSITSVSDVVMGLSNVKIKGGMPYYFDAAGREILKAMFSGGLKMKGMFTHFPSLIRLSRVMSVH